MKDTRKRPTHLFVEGVCCVLPQGWHRKPDLRKRKRPGRLRGKRGKRIKEPRRIWAIDGEGVGRDPHRYVLLTAADTRGMTRSITDGGGLSTSRCLDFLLSLPRGLVVGFSLGYDWTKILADLPDEDLWLLHHESAREYRIGDRVQTRPVQYREFEINQQARKVTIKCGKRTVVVWDVFKFFQCSFVKACSDWKITEGMETVEVMKLKRASFTHADMPAISEYCLVECRNLAALADRLIAAHQEAGLRLSAYHGPGSSASILLKRMGIDKRRGEQPAAMRDPVARAYAGGRFENARIGAIEGTLHEYDLASAYPYAATGLPCLEHGTWRLVQHPTEKALHKATAALCHWAGGAHRAGPWGGLPVRDRRGSIMFPLAGIGWTWRDEFLAAQVLARGGYTCVEAWLYRTECDCSSPFAPIAGIYRERCRWGKDGPGRALKLATNSVAGKLMQSVGHNPPFQSWIWGGLITSDTRAELLRAIAVDPEVVVMVATDGVYSQAELALRAPRDTGTSDLATPLGCWEHKRIDGGVFACRPGVYFPLAPDTTLESRARGIGRKVLVEQRDRIRSAFEARERFVELTGFTRFVGAKTSIHRDARGSYSRADNFGDWVPWAIKMSFDPRPKRAGATVGGVLIPWGVLNWESFPYEKATVRDAESLQIARLKEILFEQPDEGIVRA